MKLWHKIGLGLSGILLIAGIVQGNAIFPSIQAPSSSSHLVEIKPQEIKSDLPEVQVPPAPIVFNTTLSYGSSGTDVASLQVFLAREKLYIGRDSGYFDQVTTDAVIAFQTQENISPINGVFGLIEQGRANSIIAKHPDWLTTLSNGNEGPNVDGSTVHSPANSTNGIPAGASAICRDGEYSFSMHRSGTCSHHGGVAEWL